MQKAESPSSADTLEGLTKETAEVPLRDELRCAVHVVKSRQRATAERVPSGSLGGAAALPCQNSNNSPKPPPGPGLKLKSRRTVFRGQTGAAHLLTVTATEANEGVDCYGRAWARRDDGLWVRTFGGPSPSEARTAYALRRNVESFAAHYARSNCGFVTLTPKQGNMTPREFGRAWDDMRKHSLRWIRSYLRVLEPQERGAPHYHLCVATPFDLRPDDFNWAALHGAEDARKRGDIAEARALTRMYAKSAPDRLRICWAELRKVCGRYGLGRSEFLPFRKEAEAIAEYVGKYLEGGLHFRDERWKGARRVEYDRKESREWKRQSVRFGWVSPGATEWRRRVAEFAAAVGVDTPEEMYARFGHRWAYRLRGDVLMSSPGEWQLLLDYLAVEYGGTVSARAGVLSVGGRIFEPEKNQ